MEMRWRKRDGSPILVRLTARTVLAQLKEEIDKAVEAEYGYAEKR